MEINNKYTLQLIKGFDKNNIKFTAFIIVENNELIDKGVNIDLTKTKIIYKIKGWNINQEIINNVIEYVNKYKTNYSFFSVTNK